MGWGGGQWEAEGRDPYASGLSIAPCRGPITWTTCTVQVPLLVA